jgi:hypothetical protein
MNRSKDIGTRAETAVVRYLRAHGFPHAERRALTGTQDQGDITGTPGVCWEVKAWKRPAGDGQITAWLAETETERINARADVGVLVVRRAGVGDPNAGRWWAIMPIHDLEHILAASLARLFDAPQEPFVVDNAAPVRMLLSDVVQLLRAAGYGQPIGPG